MGIFGMLTTGASGMNAQADRLGSISDNIANAETTGYKAAGVQFSSLLLPSGMSQYNSGSVNTKITHAITTQGPLINNTTVTNVAIDGKGFYLVNPNPAALTAGSATASPTVMTRAGAFVQDGNGYLINTAGYGLMGYQTTAAGVAMDNSTGLPVNWPTFDTNGMVPIKIPGAGLTATPSTTGTMTINLNSNDVATGTPFVASFTAYDDLGVSVPLDLTFTPGAAVLPAVYTWDITVAAPVTAINPTSISFDQFGNMLADPVSGTFKFDVTFQDTTDPAATIDLVIDFAGSTQLPKNSQILYKSIGGSAPSPFNYITISETGLVNAVYKSGAIIPIYQIPLATVSGTNNLSSITGNVYMPNDTSGQMQVWQPKENGLGSVRSTSLEQSNVDIATELALMIETQRVYEANSKVFQTGSTLTDTLVNLVR
jgi:flagellar hook protein FlgE